MESEKQKNFLFQNGVIISSKSLSGNLSQAIEKAPNHYNLWIGPDHNSSYKTWFFFSISGVQLNATVTFTINNMNNQIKLFKEDHLPVYRQQTNQNWQRIKIPLQQNGIVKAQDGYQITFKHYFNKKCKYYFAFSYPFTTQDCDNLIQKQIQKNKQRMYASYQNLCLSTQKRNVKLLTLTKLNKYKQWKQINVFQDENSIKPLVFQGKKGIFISARVHPGQIASSHIMNGILLQLFTDSQTSNSLLQNFVFYIIPIINPDGVDEGNFRTDTKGKNLNRFYINPSKYQQPQIYSIKKFLMTMINKNYIEFCLDLHAHVNKQGAFIYGNSISDLKGQLQVCLFPKILAFNSPYFDYDACNFSEKNMSTKDKIDDMSKQGSSRVTIFRQTGLKACWTLQCNYNSCKYKNELKNPQVQNLKSVSNGVLLQKNIPNHNQQKVFLNIKQFNQIGRNICQSILDFYKLRPMSRYYAGKIKNRQNFINNLAIQVIRMIPFRFDNNIRKLLTGINSNMNLTDNLNKLKILLKDFQVGKENKINIRDLSAIQTANTSLKQIKKQSHEKNGTKPINQSINRMSSNSMKKTEPKYVSNQNKRFSVNKSTNLKEQTKAVLKIQSRPSKVMKPPLSQKLISDEGLKNKINLNFQNLNKDLPKAGQGMSLPISKINFK